MATKPAKGKPLPIAAAKRIATPVVYGLCDLRDGVVVYVGQAVNPHKRFEAYRGARSHNERLNAWLVESGRQLGFYVLDESPANLNEAERCRIAEFDNLFNVSMGGVEAWMRHTPQPWMAGTGVGYPSAILLQHLARDSSYELPAGYVQTIKDARSRMGIKERCLFEVDLCREILMKRSIWRDRAERWLAVTEAKMLAALEGSSNGETKQIYASDSGANLRTAV